MLRFSKNLPSTPRATTFLTCRHGRGPVEILAVLVITIVVLIIAIPVFLNTGREENWLSSAQKAAQEVSNAYVRYQLDAMPKPGLSLARIMQYARVSRTPLQIQNQLKTIRVDGLSSEEARGVLYHNCNDPNILCYQMHNGAVVWFNADEAFDGSESLNALTFAVDADGRYRQTELVKSVPFLLYADGRLRTWNDVREGTTLQGRPVFNRPELTPEWFHW